MVPRASTESFFIVIMSFIRSPARKHSKSFHHPMRRIERDISQPRRILGRTKCPSPTSLRRLPRERRTNLQQDRPGGLLTCLLFNHVEPTLLFGYPLCRVEENL